MSFRLKVVIGNFVIFLAAFLALVFQGKIVLPQSLNIGPLSIHFYGVILGISVIAAWLYLRNRLADISLTEKQLENIIYVVLISGFIGARLYHVSTNWEFYSADLISILKIWNGGLGIFGGVFAAIFSLYVYTKIYLPSIQKFGVILDWLIPAVVIAQIIGRFGNLFNYEVYGLPTDLFWGMFVPQQFRIFPYELSNFFHPLFLYESLAGLLLLLVLLRYNYLAKRFRFIDFVGSKFSLWLICYGIVRFGIEFLRIEHGYLYGFNQNLLASGAMVVIGIFILILKRKDIKNYESVSS